MYARWLKSILPKGLYGRTALILIVPVLTTMLVVSVVFMQRHFNGVTRQMTSGAVIELRYLLVAVNGAPTGDGARAAAAGIAKSLEFTARAVAPAKTARGFKRSFDDLTGKTLIATLKTGLPALLGVDLQSVDRMAVITLKTRWGPYEIRYDRGRMSASAPHQLLVLMFVAALVMTAIASVILRNQVRPIRDLARAAEAFGKGQNLYFHVSGATEVRQAGRAFLNMRNRIERQIEQRTLMLSGVSHDLRTPLTRLKLGLSMAPEDEETRALIRDVDDMEEMLDEFLAFARGDSLEETRPSDPREIALQISRDTLRGAGDITVEVPAPTVGAPVLVAMRPNAVRRALDNLVTNALRYGARCRMRLDIMADKVVFTVEDDGPGIPQSQRPRAVRPFERLDSARNQNSGTGVGLGLAIAIDIAGSHGGALNLTDSADLGGLRVEFILPR